MPKILKSTGSDFDYPNDGLSANKVNVLFEFHFSFYEKVVKK